jgi:hypothetical protein
MDYVPHSYPIPSRIDVVIGVILFMVLIAHTKANFVFWSPLVSLEAFFLIWWTWGHPSSTIISAGLCRP